MFYKVVYFEKGVRHTTDYIDDIDFKNGYVVLYYVDGDIGALDLRSIDKIEVSMIDLNDL